MDVRGLESRLGSFKAEYTPALAKIVVNVIFALFWFLLGLFLASMLWDFYNARGAAIVAGLVFLGTGLAYVIIPFRRRSGRRARLHEEGVWISIRGKEQDWRFDEVEAVRVISGQNKKMAEGLAGGLGASVGGVVGKLVTGMFGAGLEVSVDKLTGADINGYEFHVGGKRVFEVKPGYKRWKELGAEVFVGVIRELVPRTVERVKSGDQVVYDKLNRVGFGSTRLTLTQNGIQERDKPVVPWSEVVRVAQERGSVIIQTTDPGTDITFAADSTLNVVVAVPVIKQLAWDARPDAG